MLERDRFDAWLDRLCKSRDVRLKGIGHVARLMVMGSRKCLSWLMRVGRRISCDFSRHMEFDADRREAAVVGAQAFANIFRRLEQLNGATTVAWLWVKEAQNGGLFPDDYVDLVRAGEAAIADGVVSVQKKTREQSLFDTHPSDKERIAAVRAFAPNIRLELEGAAERLFRDLGAICRRATADAYDRIFRLSSAHRNMIPARDAIARMEETRAEKAAVFAMFGYPVEFCARWFRLDSTSGCERAECGGSNPKPEEFDALERRNLLQHAALRIARCGIRIDPQSFELQGGDIGTIEAGEAASRREWNALQERLRAATWKVRERLWRVREAVVSSEFEAAWTTYEALSRFQGELDEIRRLRAAEAVAREKARLVPAAVCANLLVELSSSGDATMRRVLAEAGDIATSVILDPRQPATLRGQLIVDGERSDEKVNLFLDRTASMTSRALGQLSLAALKAGEEEAAGQTA